MSQEAKWGKIEAELKAAYDLLPEDVTESDIGFRKSDFFYFMEATELLLAMEELDGVIEDNPSPGEQFWLHLLNAANLMGHLHANRYKSILASTTYKWLKLRSGQKAASTGRAEKAARALP